MNRYGFAGIKMALEAPANAVLGFEMCAEDGKRTGLVVGVPRRCLNMLDLGQTMIAAWRKDRKCDPPARWRTLYLGVKVNG